MSSRLLPLLLAALIAAPACNLLNRSDAELTEVEEAPVDEGVASERDGSSGSGRRAGATVTYAYYGWHPELAGGWCRIEGRHRHPYELPERDYAIQVVGNVIYFVGDAVAWRWGGPVWWYYGHHRIASGVWCLLDGPHSHPWKPVADVTRFRIDGGYYVWAADWDADYTVLVRRYHAPWNALVKVRVDPIQAHPRTLWVHEPGVKIDHGRHRGSVKLPAPPARVTVDVDLPSPPGHRYVGSDHRSGGIEAEARVHASGGGSEHHYVGSDHRSERREERREVRAEERRDGSSGSSEHRYVGSDHREDGRTEVRTERRTERREERREERRSEGSASGSSGSGKSSARDDGDGASRSSGRSKETGGSAGREKSSDRGDDRGSSGRTQRGSSGGDSDRSSGKGGKGGKGSSSGDKDKEKDDEDRRRR